MAASTSHIVTRLFVCCIIGAGINGLLADEKGVPVKNEPPKKMDTVKNDLNKSHRHIQEILQLDKPVTTSGVNDKKIQNTLQKLLEIYNTDVKPLEDAYRFSDLNRDAISEGEIFSKPMVLFLGPWSVGKSTMINYLLNMEESHQRLHTGAEPTTSDFTVLLHGPQYRTIKGMELVTDKTNQFSPLQKFGLGFTERLKGIELPFNLLEKISIVDTPGIIENRKQQHRGYPFNDVCQWFIDRADLIFIVFDPTKLDVGSELAIMFKQVKGHEAKLRLILNKADTVSSAELMRVYGALFWSLAPLVNVVEPPRVYVGSYWSNSYRDHTMKEVFYEEELSLLNDLNEAIKNQLGNKVSFIRRHAFYVRIHAFIVDSYLEGFRRKKGVIFGDNDKLIQHILEDPESFNIFKSILRNNDISRHDLPTAEKYREFFSINNLDFFKPLDYYCPWMSKCAMDLLQNAISEKLPKLLSSLKSAPNKDEL